MKYWRVSILSVILYIITPIPVFADKANKQSDQNTILTTDKVKRPTTITYVYDPDWAPFEWKNDIGVHTGIIVDILNLVQKKSGINLKPVNTGTWAESVELVKNGKADMFSAITQNEERENYLNFTSQDIYSYPAVLVTKFDDKHVYLDIEKDFTGKTIGIVKSSGLGDYIKKKHPQLKYIEVPSTHDGFAYLQENKIDLFAINTVTAKYYIEKKGFDDLKIALKLDYIYHLKIAIRKQLPSAVITILDNSLKNITNEELNAIFNKWTELAVEKQTNWKPLIQMASILIIIILFLGWNNRNLNQRVKERTKELTDKNIELQNALEEINTLHGIIPICSYCHSIRDDEGAWNRLEAYIMSHSEAKFSHGICPKCLPKLSKQLKSDYKKS